MDDTGDDNQHERDIQSSSSSLPADRMLLVTRCNDADTIPSC